MTILFKVVATFGLLFTYSLSMAGEVDNVALMRECSNETPQSNRVWLVNRSPKPDIPAKMCGDSRQSMKSIYIGAIDLRKIPSLGTYGLFVTIDQRRADELYKFSNALVGKVLLIAKGNEFVYDGIVGAPMRDGVIFIGVPDEHMGELVGNELFGESAKSKN